jgi:hypothetical protein
MAGKEDSRFRGNDGIGYGRRLEGKWWMPAFAGMTGEEGEPRYG